MVGHRLHGLRPREVVGVARRSGTPGSMSRSSCQPSNVSIGWLAVAVIVRPRRVVSRNTGCLPLRRPALTRERRSLRSGADGGHAGLLAAPRSTCTSSSMRLRAPVRRVVHECRSGQALPHARAGGEDDQVAGLEAAGDRVEVVEAGCGAGDRLALAGQALELVELGVEEVVDRAEVLAAVLVGDLEDRALGHVDEVARERLVASGRAPGSRRTRAGGGGASRCRARCARTGGRCRPPAPSRRAGRSPRGLRPPRGLPPA